MSESNQTVGAEVHTDELTTFIDERIDEQTSEIPDPETFAADVAEYIDTTNAELSEGQRQEVKRLIQNNLPSSLTDSQREQVFTIITNALKDADVGGGGDGDESYGDDSYGGDVRTEIDNTLSLMRVAALHSHTSMIDTGVPEGEYHPFGDWGQIITAEQDVHWRSAVIDAESEGMTRIQVYEMDYSDEETYNLGPIHASRDIKHDAGTQEIYPDLTLPTGQYFVTRDPDNVVPMRRVATDVSWDEFNSGHDVPVRVECSWRSNAGYTPDNSVFEDKYQGNNWDSRLFYFADMEFGFQTRED